MKNKHKIGDIVESRGGLKKYTIKDFEVFDNLVLYYFNEGGALPENEIRTQGYYGISKILKTSEQEKTRQIQKVLDNLDKELNDLLKND
jgi:hypothetical protein